MTVKSFKKSSYATNIKQNYEFIALTSLLFQMVVRPQTVKYVTALIPRYVLCALRNIIWDKESVLVNKALERGIISFKMS